ncbi:hypothetical protein [Flagellimonas flava]|uniref:hypothetical protein n=1 Tax=Flagellimonas flava TaxID=570519 RepID=UPI00093379B2|nr:hypothetical protein [Allomuricauda flava]
MKRRRTGVDKKYWKWNFGKRPSEELYNIKKNPYCMNNLEGKARFEESKDQLKASLYAHLENQNDLRVQG